MVALFRQQQSAFDQSAALLVVLLSLASNLPVTAGAPASSVARRSTSYLSSRGESISALTAREDSIEDEDISEEYEATHVAVRSFEEDEVHDDVERRDADEDDDEPGSASGIDRREIEDIVELVVRSMNGGSPPMDPKPKGMATGKGKTGSKGKGMGKGKGNSSEEKKKKMKAEEAKKKKEMEMKKKKEKEMKMKADEQRKKMMEKMKKMKGGKSSNSTTTTSPPPLSTGSKLPIPNKKDSSTGKKAAVAGGDKNKMQVRDEGLVRKRDALNAEAAY